MPKPLRAAGRPVVHTPVPADATLEPGGTSHFVIVDARGNAVSMTTTIESAFGSHLMVRGFLLNNQLTDFSFAPAGSDGAPVANRVEGGKRPRSSMSPVLVFGDGMRLEAVLGSPGGSAIIRYVMVAVFFTLLVVAGNTMAQSVRERTAELAVLKTLGFSSGSVMALVLAESCVLALVGGGIGLALGAAMVAAGDPTGGFLPVFFLPDKDLALGVGLILALGLVTGFLPAMKAMRLRIVDALRRG